MQFMTSACIETFPSKNPPRGLTTNSSIDGCSRCSRSRSIRSSGALYSKGPSKTIRQRHQFQQHQEQRKRPHLKHPSRMASQPPVQLLLFMQIDRKKSSSIAPQNSRATSICKCSNKLPYGRPVGRIFPTPQNSRLLLALYNSRGSVI